MEDKLKFLDNVILLDVAFLNEIVGNIQTYWETRLNRKLPDLDLPAWLSYLALDAGLREGDNEIQVLLVYDGEAVQLQGCQPDTLKELDGMACRTPLGEFMFSCVSAAGMVSNEQLYLDLLTLALDSAEPKQVLLVPHLATEVEEILQKHFSEKTAEECNKAIYFCMAEPKQPVYCRCDIVFFSLMHALGIRGDEL